MTDDGPPYDVIILPHITTLRSAKTIDVLRGLTETMSRLRSGEWAAFISLAAASVWIVGSFLVTIDPPFRKPTNLAKDR